MATLPTKRSFADRLSLFFFGWVFKKRFVGGDDIDSVLKTGEEYVSRGISVSYDFMVENLQTPEEVDRAVRVTCVLANEMTHENIGNIVVKPSMYGLDLAEGGYAFSEADFQRNLGKLLAVVGRTELPGVEVEVDAERAEKLSSQYSVAHTILALRPDYVPRLRQAVQMHLTVTPELVADYQLTKRPIRIVKGTKVYDEDARLIVSDEIMKKNFIETFLESLRRGQHPYLATMRDRSITREAIKRANEEGFGKGDFTVQFLHGLGRGLLEELHREGHSVRVYVPFVMPFCANAWEGYIARRIKMVRGLLWKWITAPFVAFWRFTKAGFAPHIPPPYN